jgi:hypothetical protein
MKSSTNIALQKYLAGIGGALLVNQEVNAQIQYHDFDPDIVISNERFMLDLNMDAVDDFQLVDTNIVSYNMWIGGIYGMSSNSMQGDITSGFNYPFKLQFGDPIDATQSWVNNWGSMTIVTSGTSPYSSHWINGVNDGYMGLRIHVGGQTYYGWARMDLPATGDSIILKDMAYNTISFEGLGAGEMPVSVAENELSGFTFHLSGNQITVQTAVENKYQFRLMSVEGKIIHSENTSGTFLYSGQQLPAGIYLLEIIADGKRRIQQIFISQ